MKKTLIYIFLLFSPFLFSCEEEQDVAPIESLFFGDGVGSAILKDSISIFTLEATEVTDTSAVINVAVDYYNFKDASQKVKVGYLFRFWDYDKELLNDENGFSFYFLRDINSIKEPHNRQIKGLNPETRYIYRAYAETENGEIVAYGETKSFTTKKAPKLIPDKYAGARYNYLSKDEFDDGVNTIWAQVETDRLKFEIRDGYYYCTAKANSYMGSAILVNLDETRNFEIEMSMQIFSAPANEWGNGLLWGGSDFNNAYFFSISQYHNYTMGDKNNGQFSLWKNWATHPTLAPTASDKMTVRKYGNKLYFFLNEQFVYSRNYVSKKGNRHQITIAPLTAIRVDYFYVSYITN